MNLLASDQELAYLRSMDWEVKGAHDLQTDRFEDAGIIGDNTSIFFMPRSDYPLLNDLIMKLQKADALQNSFFVTNNFFIRNEDSESDNEDPEKSVVLEKKQDALWSALPDNFSF
uniref:Uncharacterized protein n=1 Tax=Ditylenchus dipsaci TaxID=166011 RepID=A0A915D9G0_9BILA